MKNKYDIKKLKESFEVKILWSESEEFLGKENIVYSTEREIEALEHKLKRISSEMYGKGKGYHKTKYELRLLGEKFYSGRADLGDFDAAGIAKHIDMYLSWEIERNDKDYRALKELVQFLFGETKEIEDVVIEEILNKDELQRIS